MMGTNHYFAANMEVVGWEACRGPRALAKKTRNKRNTVHPARPFLILLLKGTTIKASQVVVANVA